MITPINQPKHLRQLKEHDRFVFTKERQKRKVWQVVQHIVVTVNNETKLMTRCINDNLETKRFDGNRVVTFLRNDSPNATVRRISRKRSWKDELQ